VWSDRGTDNGDEFLVLLLVLLAARDNIAMMNVAIAAVLQRQLLSSVRKNDTALGAFSFLHNM